MVRLVRHCQTKETETDRPNLNHYASSLLYPSIRYDCAHDYAHKDCYNINGQCRKINLFLDYRDALILADDDINENWEIYRGKFLKGEFSMTDKKRFTEKNSMLVKEFDRYVLEHPKFTDKIPNNALIVMQIEGDDEFNNWARETA